jgi:hypothetical protein
MYCTPLKPVVTVRTAKFNTHQDGQCTYNVILKGVRATIGAAEKLLSICNTYEFVFAALVNQHSMRMRQIVICGLPRALQYFSTLSHKTT